MRILLVEDEFLLAHAMEAALGALGFDVVGPYSGVNEAVAAIRTETVECAILDINLCGELSYPVAQELASRHVPFIFASALDGPGIDTQFRHYPFLRKPFCARALSDAIHCFLTAPDLAPPT